MAEPFIYVPEDDVQATPYNPFYRAPSHPNSPFLPPGTPLQSSPFFASPGLPSSRPGTPQGFVPNSVLWQGHGSPSLSPPAFGPRFSPFSQPQRQRTISWHAPAANPGSPFLSPVVPAGLLPTEWQGHRRASSFGAASAPPTPWLAAAGTADPWAAAALVPIAPRMHPCLNGEAPAALFHLDLAPSRFAPLRLVPHGQSVPLSDGELREQAFYPPRMSLRILHPRLPFYPIDLTLPESATPITFPPIALGDVLVAIHRDLHARITPDDWAALSADDQAAINQAFTRRCRTEAAASTDGVPAAHWREREIAERNEGVKRVDFLVGKTVFKGLVRDEEDPEGVLRMVTV
ncbi:hypothetical protein C8F01DRAFT_1177763 [Mycena amicta]|nr:hypothetical protein C8F01DRAFT_1177763 [Mycena amicta]